MSDLKVLALFQQLLGVTALERGVLEDLVCQRLITAGLTVSGSGVLATTVPMAISVDPVNLSSPVPPAKGGTGVANNAASTLTVTGAFALGLTLTNTTALTLPTAGTLLTTTGSIAGLTGTIASATQDLITRTGTVTSGVWSGTIAAATQDLITRLGTIVSGVWNAGAVTSSSTIKATTTMAVGGATPAATGAGLTFPTVAAPSSDVKTLDEYEEGSWTPVLTNFTVVGGTTLSGTYTKTGNQVTVYAFIKAATSLASTVGSSFITGMPFVAAALSTCTAYVTNIPVGATGGLLDPTSSGANTRIYTPTWTAQPNFIVVVATYTAV